jgi:hypothetical protein
MFQRYQWTERDAWWTGIRLLGWNVSPKDRLDENI